MAHAEAYIDFHEDQHIENDILTEGMQVVLKLISYNSTTDDITKFLYGLISNVLFTLVRTFLLLLEKYNAALFDGVSCIRLILNSHFIDIYFDMFP